MFHSDTQAESVFADERPRRSGADGQTSLFDPAALANGIWQRRGFIVLATVLGVGLAGAYAYSTPKAYTGIAQLVLDPRDLNIVQNDVTSSQTGMSTDGTLALVESQIAVMTSNSVLERVVSQAGLTADPEFNGTRESLFSGVTSLVNAFLSSNEDAVIRDRQLLTIANLAKHVKAVRNANSFVINLSVTSEDPDKAARLANLITENFIAEQGRAQSELARRATTALSSRLAELRQRVVAAEDAVEAYKADNKLVGVGGRLIDDDYITRINSQLADVRAQITTLDVRAQSLRRASVSDVVEGSFPEGLNSETLQRLRQAYTEATQSAAVLATRLGPRHPQRIGADEAVTAARRAIQNELGRIVASAQTELARARDTEADLSRQIDTLRSRQIETSSSFVKLRELEREVDASRAVYEAYLLRTRQTSEQESLNTANVRVISEATVPLQPSSLSRRIVMAAGGVAGLGVGIMLAALGAMLSILRGGAGSARRTEDERGETERLGEGFTLRRAEAPIPAAADWSLRGSAAEAEAHEPIRRAQEPSVVSPVDAEDEAPRASIRDAGDEPGDESEFETARTAREQDEFKGDHEAFEDEHEHAVHAPSDPEFDLNEGDLDRRRAELRERIRAIGLRRSGVRRFQPAEELDAPSLDAAPSGFDEASKRLDDLSELAQPNEPANPPTVEETARERISLTMTAARQRRSLLVQPSS
ncbi:GumC family protein [Aureimonas sp. D3]|uniref:GumC family protein n=1 Tax=Aureimonas sp. D3 TaxID=1638164 RepID=UPI0007835985|nr:GumC family protein [Aureimonas sp. D3]